MTSRPADITYEMSARFWPPGLVARPDPPRCVPFTERYRLQLWVTATSPMKAKCMAAMWPVSGVP